MSDEAEPGREERGKNWRGRGGADSVFGVGSKGSLGRSGAGARVGRVRWGGKFE